MEEYKDIIMTIIWIAIGIVVATLFFSSSFFTPYRTDSYYTETEYRVEPDGYWY